MYDLRHLFATTMLANGADLAAVSKLMGHSTVKITADVYFAIHGDGDAGILERLREILASGLRSLVRIDDFRHPVTIHGLFRGDDTKISIQGVGQPPGQDCPAVPVHDRHQVNAKPGEDVRAHRMDFEFESRHDVVIASPVAKHPEKVGIFRLAGAKEYTVSRDMDARRAK